MIARLKGALSIWTVKVVGLTIACYVVGQLGRVTSIPTGDVVNLWSVSGIALAGLLRFGNGVWPGLWLGSFLVELTPILEASPASLAAKPIFAAVAISLGTVLQAMAGRWVVLRALGKVPTLDRLKEVIVLLGLGGFVSAVLGATLRAGLSTWAADGIPHSWWGSWCAELNGVVVFAPLVLILAEASAGFAVRPRPLWLLESITLFVIIPSTVLWFAQERGTDYGAILVFVSALWATLRFGKVGTALSLLSVALLVSANVRTGTALLGTIRVARNAAALDAQSLQGSLTVTLWTLAAILDERERAAKGLRESEARFRQFSEGLSQIIWMMSPDRRRFLYVNEAFERIFGRKREELYAAGDIWLQAIHPEDRLRVSEFRFNSEPRHEHFEEYRVVHTDGTVRWLRERTVPLRNERGEISLFAGTAEDITQTRQIAAELARQQSELLHVSRLSSVGQMVATLSHEVAQPMSAIGTFATVCAKAIRSMPPEERDRLHNLEQCIEDIAAENERCRKILRRLRDYSRKTPWRRVPCDVNAVLRESVSLIANELQRFDVKIHLELAASIPVIIADPIQLQQVVINLLSNARDALLEVAPSRRLIVLRSTTDGNSVQIDVEDQGIGLPADDAKRIFDPFFTTKAHGMGIGLSICKTILEEHSGQIRAFANDNNGATIRITLPVGDRESPAEVKVGSHAVT